MMIQLSDEWKAKFLITWDFWEESSRTGIEKKDFARYNELSQMPGDCAFCGFFDNGTGGKIENPCPLSKNYCFGSILKCCNGLYLYFHNIPTNKSRQPYSKQIFEMVDKSCRDLGVFK